MRKSIIAAAIGAVIAPAVSANIVITEVVEGSSNNKAIEVANVGSSSMTLDGYSLMIESNGSGDWGNAHDLAGVTLASGETYVVTHAQAAAELLAKGQATGTVTYFNGDDSIALFKDGSIVDILGYVNDTDYNKNVTLKRTDMSPSTSYDPNKFEELATDDWTDIGNVDLEVGAPNILITEVVEGSSNNKAIEIANVGTVAATLTGYTLMVEFNGAGEWKNPYDLSAVTLEPGKTFVVANSSAAQDLLDRSDDTGNITYFSGDDSLALFKDGEIVDIVGYVNDTDYNKDITLKRTVMTASTAYDATKFVELEKDNWTDIGNVDLGGGTPDPDPDPDPTDPDLTLISALQGDSWESPYTDVANGKYTSDETFTVEGVVTAINASGDALTNGFFIQDVTTDGNENTSDGIFVTGVDASGFAVGDVVRVTGPVTENYGWTQIPATSATKTDKTADVVAVNLEKLASDEEFDFTLERYEGMLVNIPSTAEMRVSRSYSFDEGPKHFNMVLSSGGASVHPNQSFFPGTDKALQAADCNEDNRLVVESFSKETAGAPTWYPDFGKTDVDQNGSTEDYIRVGDRASGLQGVLGYSYSDYRFYVTEDADNDTFQSRGNNRDLVPQIEDGDIKIATFNTQGYINSTIDGEANSFLADDANIGAQSAEEFAAQTTKLVAALTALDADIIGLMEVENNGFGESSAIAYLVTQLNADLDESMQYHIASAEGLENVGELATSNYVIFRASKVGLDSLTTIAMPEQHIDDQVVAQHDAVVPVFTFKDREEKLVVAVNNFIDKDSTCSDDDGDNNMQGACAALRASAADYLGQQLADIDGEKVVLGSLNAFANEDALTVLTNREQAPEGYEILAAKNTFVGEEALVGDEDVVLETSYGFEDVLSIVDSKGYNAVRGDENGSLDYILTSAGLKSKLVDAAQWNINAGESESFAASNETIGQNYPDQFRSAQNDPVIISLAFDGKPLDPVDPVFPDPDQPIEPGTPIQLPSEPINEPRLDTPNAGGFDYFVDLTTYSESAYLKVGDEVTVSFSDVDGAFVARSSSVAKDILDEREIALGWTEVPVEGISEGEYTVTTSVAGTVLESKTVAVAEASSGGSSSGGSAGFGGLLALLGLGFLRRKFK